MTQTPRHSLQDALEARYSDAPAVSADETSSEVLQSMAGRGSCRSFLDRPVPMDVLRMLCATALASPSKSDLQQRDIILLRSQAQRSAVADLVGGQAWVASAPMIAVFCGNNRRQRLMHDWHNVPFENDHLDAFFNAATDAAIALGAFVTAAETLGLGCCPISAVRNEAPAVSNLLDLPQHVFPFAGLAIGYPARPPSITMRLPLKVTCHVDQYNEEGLQEAIQTYDATRRHVQPYSKQRFAETFGETTTYGWSDDKVRQYSQPEREAFGAYVRAQGFSLD